MSEKVSETPIKERVCRDCEKRSADVLTLPGEWSAWGRSIADFNWEKSNAPVNLCEQCETDNYRICSKCGYAITAECANSGYINSSGDDDLDDEFCPECRVLAGRIVDVKIIIPVEEPTP